MHDIRVGTNIAGGDSGGNSNFSFEFHKVFSIASGVSGVHDNVAMYFAPSKCRYEYFTCERVCTILESSTSSKSSSTQTHHLNNPSLSLHAYI